MKQKLRIEKSNRLFSNNREDFNIQISVCVKQPTEDEQEIEDFNNTINLIGVTM